MGMFFESEGGNSKVGRMGDSCQEDRNRLWKPIRNRACGNPVKSAESGNGPGIRWNLNEGTQKVYIFRKMLRIPIFCRESA